MWTIYKNKERIKKFKETGDSQYIYQNKLNKTYFQQDMVYGDFKDLTRGKTSKLLRDKALLKIQHMMDINVELLE